MARIDWRHVLVGVALFVILPFSLAPKLVFGGSLGILAAWREFIVFVLPVMMVLSASFRRQLKEPEIIFAVLLLFLLCHAVFAGLPKQQIVIGFLGYAVPICMLPFFRGIDWRAAKVFYSSICWGTVIGGLGLAYDYLSGFKISALFYTAGLEFIENQNTLVKRTMFLYSGQNNAASYLVLSIICIVVGLLLFKPQFGRRTVILAYTAIGVGAFGVLFTFSLVGYFGVALACAPLFLLSKHPLKAGGVVFLVMIGLAVLLAVGRNTDEGDHIMRRIEGIGFGGAGESETERQRKNAWWSGVRSMPQHLIIGTGIGTGNSRSTGQGFEVTHYESYPLAVANEAGLFGLAIGLYPFVLPFFLPARIRGMTMGTRLFLHYSSVLSLILIAMNPSAFAFEYACLALYKVALLRIAVTMRKDAARGSANPAVRMPR